MSSVLVIQTANTIFVGSDTAISTNINDEIYRVSENAKKLFKIHNKIIFCSGRLELSYKIIDEFQDSKNFSVENLKNIAQSFYNQYIKKENVVTEDFVLDIVVCEFKGTKSATYQISPYNDFEIVENNVCGSDIGIWAGGVKTKECWEYAYQNLKNKCSIVQTFTNVFNAISFEGIGGNLIVYEMNPATISPICSNKIIEKPNLKRLDSKNLKLNLVIAERLIGQIIAGEDLTITTGNGDFLVNQTGVWIRGTSLNIIDNFPYVDNAINGAKQYTDTKIEDIIDIIPPNVSSANVSATANNDGTITLTWNGFIDEKSGVKGYNIWRNTINNVATANLISGISNPMTLSHIDTNTVNNTRYWYWVSAFDKSGNESEKVALTGNSIIAKDNEKPSPPTELKIKGGWGRIDLSWQSPIDKDILKYKIRISDDSNFSSFMDNYSFSSNYTDFDRKDTNTRYYRIYAIDKSENESETYLSGQGNAFLPSDSEKPIRPLDGNVASDDDGRLIVTFTGSTSNDSANYRIVRYSVGSSVGYDLSTIKHMGNIEHKFTDSYLEKDKSYYYQIYTIDNSGNLSDEYLRLPLTGGIKAVDITPPPIPNINFIQSKIGAITIGWEQAGDAIDYKIYRYNVSGTNETYIGKTSQLQFTDSSMSVNNSVQYQYRITSLDKWGNESGKSQSSGVVQSLTPFTANDNTPPTVGTINTPIVDQNGTILLTWSGFVDTESGVSGYNIWRFIEGQPMDSRILLVSINNKNIESYRDKDVVSGTSYRYYITCFDNAGNETDIATNLSQWVSATSLDTIPPQAPTNIVVAGGLGTITVSWTPPQDEDLRKYIIQIGNDINDFNPPSEEYGVFIPSFTDYGRDSLNRRYYRIYSIDIAGNVSETYLSGDGSAAIPGSGEVPNSPNKPTTASNYDGSITISWTHNNPSSDIAKYRIFRRLEGDPNYKDVSEYGSDDGYGEAGYAESYMISLGEVDSNTMEFTDTGLKNGQEYKYSIAAISYAGLRSDRSDDSDVSIATDNKPPDTTNLNLQTQGRAGSILLTWNESPNERGEVYEIWRSTTINGSYSKIATVAGSNDDKINTNSYSDNSMEVGEEKTYYYRIRAVDSWGNISNYSSPIMGKSIGFTGIEEGSTIVDFVDVIFPKERDELKKSIDDLKEYLSDGVITQLEAEQLRLSLAQVQKESIDIINIAVALGITTEKTNYEIALNNLSNELNTKWIGQNNYPLNITPTERNIVLGLFEDVQNKKSVLINKISQIREQRSKDYTDNNAVIIDKNYTNGIRIDSANGVVVTRSDDRAKTTLNATDGIKIETKIGSTWSNKFYVDLSGNLNIAGNMVMQGGQIRNGNDVLIDLDTRTIDFSKFNTMIGKISANNIKVDELFVGTGGIRLDSSATIDWSTQVYNKPSIPSQYTDNQAINAIQSTYISKDGILAPQISANHIVAGVISADRVATNISQVNKTLSIGDSLDNGAVIFYGSGTGSNSSYIIHASTDFMMASFAPISIFTGSGSEVRVNTNGNNVRLSSNSYLGTVSEDSRIATRGWVQNNAVARFG